MYIDLFFFSLPSTLELLNNMLHRRHEEESKTIWQGNVALSSSNRDDHSAKAYRCLNMKTIRQAMQSMP